jgi:hypothetical protein
VHGPITSGSRKGCTRFNPRTFKERSNYIILAFQRFGVRYFRNTDDKRSGHFTVKTPKSQNATCLWSRTSTFRLFKVWKVEGAEILVPIISNYQYVKQQKHHDRPLQRTHGRDSNTSGFQILRDRGPRVQSQRICESRSLEKCI